MFQQHISVRRFISMGSTVIISTLLFSCGKIAEQTSLKIYGGTTSNSDTWDNVVAISDKDVLYCTGTALTPTLIVTAAHCVVDETMEDLRVATGPGIEGHETRGDYKVKKMGFSNRFDVTDSDSSFDVGYLLLSSPLNIPAESFIKPLILPEELKQIVSKGVSSTLVGYGAREDGGYGLKYEVISPIRKVLANEVKIGAAGKDACQGDSGGPAFAQLKSGEWRLFGVTSRGIDCGNGGFWGLVNKSICWVQKDSGADLGLPKGSCGQ
ncbi:MAG: trypsin-like serine protease [Pseudomonas sp.]|nr:MAG: trypsin-like serine protease [Pseudomonas sp.]